MAASDRNLSGATLYRGHRGNKQQSLRRAGGPVIIAFMKEPRSILITGASSGIGAALARAYAAPGVILFLGGRDKERLRQIGQECGERGATVRAAVVDVADGQNCARWINDCEGVKPLDLVIANAGISAGSGGHDMREETPAAMGRIFAVNVGGTLNTVLPALAHMRRRKRGQIAVVSSLAGFVGTPGLGAYCASKAAQRLMGESLRLELAGEGIEVSVVCPGFIRTPMTEKNEFYMPFLMHAEKAAAIIRRGLARNRPRIAFPWLLYAFALFGAALPPAMTEMVMKRFPRKRGAAG